jgi:transcriptional regulator with XRE-family HTH domain
MAVHDLQLFPQRLRRARTTAGLSQAQVATAAGVAGSRLCAIEKGRRWITDVALVPRLLDAVTNDAALRAQLQSAVAHDQVLNAMVLAGIGSETLALVSSALQLAECLSTQDQMKLGHYLDELRRNTQALLPVFGAAREIGGAP